MNAQAMPSQRFFAGNIFKHVLLFVCLAASFLLAAVYGGKLAPMLFVSVLVLSLYLLLGRWSGIARISGERTMHPEAGTTPLEAGSRLQVSLRLRLPGFWPVPYVLLSDRLVRMNGGEHRFEATVIPDRRRSAEAAYTIPSLARGIYSFADTECMTGDLLGFFEHKGIMKLHRAFAVAPRIVPIPEWSGLHLWGWSGRSGGALSAAHAGGESGLIGGVREYRDGDRLSRIHWSATARTGELKSKEFEQESAAPVAIVLDRCKASYSGEEQFELAVSIAVSLLKHGRDKGIGMELMSMGGSSGDWKPGGGGSGWSKQLEHLTAVAADAPEPLPALISRQLHRLAAGISVIMVTGQTGEPVLKAAARLHARQLAAAHIQAAWPEAREESEAWSSRLNSAGVPSYCIGSLEELPHALRGDGNGA